MTTRQTPDAVREAAYVAAVVECHASHTQHNDYEGAHALWKMLGHPRRQHRTAIQLMTTHCRTVCLNAIEYAEQVAR